MRRFLREHQTIHEHGIINGSTDSLDGFNIIQVDIMGYNETVSILPTRKCKRREKCRKVRKEPVAGSITRKTASTARGAKKFEWVNTSFEESEVMQA
jgi:hypothetical protein